MANVTVVGAQWGDEGKGKIVDWLSERAEIVVRFQGGHNAGHTLVIDGVTYKLSLLPSGVVRRGKLSIIGNGVVIDPWALVAEIEAMRAKGVAMLRTEFVKAREYAAKRAKPGSDTPRDLRLEALADVLAGRLTALVTAHHVVDILAALRLREEFGFPMVLDGAAESHLIVDRIKAAGIPVILHPTMARHGGVTKQASFTTFATLRAAGIPVALQSGFEGYVPKTRLPLFEAAVATAFGASRLVGRALVRLLGILNRSRFPAAPARAVS